MNDKLLKPYNPQETESRIYEMWEKSGLFNPDVCIKENVIPKDAPAFSMVMPPPNVTGILHIGHALMITIEDILVRYNRMRGKKTVWIPGTDHAAIATQSKVEKEISKQEGKSRHDLGREELLRRIEVYAKESHDSIVRQIKKLGASCDWSREAYTLDDLRSRAVNTVFKKMYDEGLIYRGERIVNWDPKGQTTISDDEIVYKEEKAQFYYLTYGPFTIGTARPETKFGDKYVVMHPDDERYKKYKHGQKIDLEWINGPITATVIKDPVMDMSFGTGVMTITPSHSLVDFELAEKYNLDKEQIIDLQGRLLKVAGEFAGLKIAEGRKKVLEKLAAKGLLVKTESYTHNVATAERTSGTIEPQILKQWFIDVDKKIPARGNKSLKELARDAVASGKIEVIPDYFSKTYFHWIDNLRDWCISRQIWYGHRIPVWYKNKDGKKEETFCGVEAPEGDGWTQDPDTLDTWFSASLWTFSVLGWPDEKEMKKNHFDLFHPTSVLETGYDIIFFWVARMILMTEYVLDTVPFHRVYLHGIVRDGKGEKMSKSLGNALDPLLLAEKFGADAERIALVVGTAAGTDSKVDEKKIAGYKNFANKIWNIARFVLSSLPQDYSEEKINFPAKTLEENDKKIMKEFETLAADITADMEAYRFHLASEKIYHYIWHRFADVIIEDSKKIFLGNEEKMKISRQKTLFHILKMSLALLHPFMPFVTEELWSMLPGTSRGKPLMVERWPVIE